MTSFNSNKIKWYYEFDFFMKLFLLTLEKKKQMKVT